MGLTTDPKDDCLREIRPDGMQECYLILSDEERSRGFIRPVRRSYVHVQCGSVTTMAQELAETYARDPSFYGGTFCASCRTHFRLVTEAGPQFMWDGTSEAVGS